MDSAFWRYQLILSALYLFWSEFFVTGGFLSQLTLNFALFYPLGFLVGYRRRSENLQSAYLAAVCFNIFSYLLASVLEVPVGSWITVGLDFVSLLILLRVGMYIGQRAQAEE